MELRVVRAAGLLCVVLSAGCNRPLAAEQGRLVRDLVGAEVVAAKIPGMHGLAADGYGNLYVAGSGWQGSVLRIAADGERVPVATGLGRVAGLARDDNGNLFVAMTRQKGGLYRIGSDGRRSMVAKGIGFPAEVGVDDLGRVFIAETKPRGRLLRYADEELLSWAGPLDRPRGVAADVDGAIYVCESGTGRLLRYRADGVRHVLVPQGILKQPGAILYTPQYRGLFVTEDSPHGRLVFVSVDGAVVSLLFDLRRPQSLAMDGQGNLYVAERDRQHILRVGAAAIDAALNPPR